MSFPYKAVAISKYKPPPGATGLSFQIGDIISVIEEADEDGDYLLGEDTKGVRGVFPATSVNKVEDAEAEEGKSGAGADAEASPQTASGPTSPTAAVAATPPILESIPVASPPLSTPSTPSRQPSLPSPPAPLAPSAPTPSSPPTSDAASEAPKKPSSLRDRIAALNAQGAGALPPPVPRSSKPPSFARKPLTMPPPAPSLPVPASVVSPQPQSQAQPQATATPSPPTIASPPLPSNDSSIERSGTEGAMSAEDAKASIGKGGSLKDRIAALQGGFKAEVPQPPGRAPKPWKKKSVEVAPAEDDAVESAEPVAVASKEIKEGEEAPSLESTATSAPVAKSVEPDNPTPLAVAPTEDEESSPSAAAVPAADEEDLDPEEAKKAALVARMASLGGQRPGMLMPALPKRAGPPRKKSGGTAPASPVEKAESEPVQEKEKEVEPPSLPVEQGVEKAETIEEPVAPAATTKEDAEVAAITIPSAALLAGAGVGAAAVATHTHEDSAATPEHDEDEDDFDTPSLPPTATRPVVPSTPPSMPTRPVAPVMDEHVTPPSEGAAEKEIAGSGEEEHEAVPEEEEQEAEEPVEEEDEEEPTAPPPLPAGRPPIPASFAPPTPATSLPPPPPTRSVAPPPPAPIEPEEEEEEVTPSSPSTASRPAIPRIPSNFAHQHGHRVASEDGVVDPEPEEEEAAAANEPEEEEEVEESKVPQDEASKEEDAPPPVAARRVIAPAGLAGMFGAPRPPVPSAPAPATESQEKGVEGGEEEEEESGEEEDDEDEEEEEEDPEIARRRAIAARMAKLGGGGMRMGPMFPPIGGLKPAPASTGVKKKKKKSKSVEQPKEVADEAVSPAAEEESAPPPPPRMPGGIPQGGFLLPGMLPRAVPTPGAESTQDEDDAEVGEPTVEETAEEEPEVAPPPLPAGRPSGGPPRRSIPVPQDEAAESPPPLPSGRPLSPPARYVEEPEQEDYDEEERAPTPPPRRMSIPTSPPPLAAGTLPPSTPPSRRPTLPTGPPTPAKDETPSSPPERRASVTSKKRFSGAGAGMLGIAIPRGSMDLERTTSPTSPVLPGSPIQATQTRASTMSVPAAGGNFKAKDVDLAQTSQWWRLEPFAPPVSVTSRPDATFDVSESTSSKRGKTKHDNTIEVVYDDLSKTVISVAFVDDDPNEGSTSLSQAHFGPPPVNSAQLGQFSATFGAQVFAAAHSKSADKSRGLTPEQFLSFCFSRATDLLPPIGYSFGIPVYTIRVTDPKSKAVVNELDEPRSGDIAVMWDCKFKHNLTTQKVGTAEKPGVSIVQAWDSKKKKLRTLEVEKDGSVGEEAYRIEDLKGGAVFVYRVVDRGFLDA